jgi:hypothetical protein
LTRADFDVVVVGGGSAGLAAAVGAARTGARTLLVERHGFLGGMGTASLVHTLCGLYLLRSEPGAVIANPGFASELAGRLIAAGAAGPPVRIGRVDVLPHHPTGFASVADRVVRETPELELRLHTEALAAGRSGSAWMIETDCRGARTAIEARALVDASGDASCLALLGAGVEQTDGGLLQRPALICALGGIDEGALDDDGRLKVAHAIATGVRAGDLPAAALGASFRASGRPAEAFATLDLDGPEGAPYDPLDPACLTALETSGRALAEVLVGFLRRRVGGFARAFVAAWPTRVGVRESRRAEGAYRLDSRDLLTGASFPDSIARATWPMEMRERAARMRLRFPEVDRPADIPLRSLSIPRYEGVFVAGRCLSASHEAQASIRVMGTCLATGEAAGIAAALAADTGAAPSAAAVVAARERSSPAEAARAGAVH